jgi:hypothetical protein
MANGLSFPTNDVSRVYGVMFNGKCGIVWLVCY